MASAFILQYQESTDQEDVSNYSDPTFTEVKEEVQEDEPKGQSAMSSETVLRSSEPHSGDQEIDLPITKTSTREEDDYVTSGSSLVPFGVTQTRVREEPDEQEQSFRFIAKPQSPPTETKTREEEDHRKADPGLIPTE